MTIFDSNSINILNLLNSFLLQDLFVVVILILLLFLMLVGAIYLALLILISTIKLINIPIPLLENQFDLRIKTLSFALVVAALISYFFLFTSPFANYKSALIATKNKYFILTVKGKRVSMVHDPISVFLRGTYEDSISFILPRSHGIIRGSEILSQPGFYKYVGAITVENDELEIKLFSTDPETKKLYPDDWNGKYSILWLNRSIH